MSFKMIDEEFKCENCGKDVKKLRIYGKRSLPILLIFKTFRYISRG